MRLLSRFRGKINNKQRIIYPRHLFIDHHDGARGRNYPTNTIKTSRYTWYNFIVKNLWEQYHNFAIVLYTLLSIVNVIIKSTFSVSALLVPMIVIIIISMIRDCIVDILRYRRDRKVNRRKFKLVKPSGDAIKWVDIRAENIRVGDVLLIERDQEFPCDLIALASASPSTEVKVTTANLDGETSIKKYHALVSTQPVYRQLYPNENDEDGLKQQLDRRGLWFELECEPPNIDLTKFESRFRTKTADGKLTDWLPLSTDNLLLRGTRIKQTDFVIACCVYTGQETKLSINSLPVKRKFTSRDRRFNQIWLVFFTGFLIFPLFSTISNIVWVKSTGVNMFYIPRVEFSIYFFFQSYSGFLFIYIFIVPISMLLMLDFHLMFNSFFISRDLGLYSNETDEKCTANSILLPDELGQVEYLFSDKTGTLTRNQMKLRFCATLTNEQDGNERPMTIYACYDGHRGPMQSNRSLRQALAEMSQCQDWITEELCYSSSSDSDSSSTEGESTPKSPSKTSKRRRKPRFSREASLRQSRSLQPRCFPINLTANNNLVEVFKQIALCHTVEVTDGRSGRRTREKITTTHYYESSSPDEKALVEGAAALGVVLSNTESSRLVPGGLTYTLDLSNLLNETVASSSSSSPPSESSSPSTYHIDAVLPFDPFRKRMSIMARHPDGSFHIHSKGADSVMLSSNSDDEGFSSQINRTATSCVNEFAQLGLRTLVYASRRLESEAEYNQLIDQLKSALVVIGDGRQQAISDAHLAIEQGLMPIAVTAVEDSLQEGVKDCLACLTEAGIKTWVLTGDKIETAITVSKAAGHFPQDAKICRLTNATSIDSAQDLLDAIESSFESRNVDQTVPATNVESSGETKGSDNPIGSQSYPTPMCLVIDGTTIDFLLLPSLRGKFSHQCARASSVLCCRLTPIQKAKIVSMVQSGSLKVKSRSKFLDNCYRLIGAVHFPDSVKRLAGKFWEGVLNSCLKRLLLVHGHWANHRLTLTMNFYYFKSVALVANQIIFSCFNGFSKMTNFGSFLYVFYNMTFTSFSLQVFGIFEQNLSADKLLKHPHLYRLIRKLSNLSSCNVISWIAEGIWHGGVIFTLTNLLLADQAPFHERDRTRGTFVSEVDLGMTGYAMYMLLVISVNLRLALCMRNLNWVVHLGFFAVLLHLPLLYKNEKSVYDLQFANFTNLFFCPSFWLLLPLTQFTCLLPGILRRLASDVWWKGQMRLAKLSHGHERRRLRRSWRFWAGVLATSSEKEDPVSITGGGGGAI